MDFNATGFWYTTADKFFTECQAAYRPSIINGLQLHMKIYPKNSAFTPIPINRNNWGFSQHLSRLDCIHDSLAMRS